MGLNTVSSTRRWLVYLLVISLIVVFDQWTKWLISSGFELYEARPITQWFNLVLAHNTGAAFSFLSNAGGWQRWFFVVLTVVAVVVLTVWLKRSASTAQRLRCGILLVLGGAIGNLIDRVRLGYVVDFLDVHVSGWHWPAFNVADSAIFCGMALLILDAFMDGRKKAQV